MLQDGVNWDIDFTILGEPASAKNQRRIVKFGGKFRLIKSKKALDYSAYFNEQVASIGFSDESILVGDVALRLDVFYSSRRPDLAAMDLVMDLLQGVIYKNDRQVKASQSLWNLDKENPRVRILARKIRVDCSVGTSSYSPSEIWG